MTLGWNYAKNAPRNADENRAPACGLFVLALQQIVDSVLAGLLSDEAFEWLAEQQNRADQILAVRAH